MILLHQRRAKRKLPFARTGVDSNKKQVAQNATSTVERRIQPRFESRQFDRSTPYRFVKTRFEAVSRFSSLPHSATFVRQNIAGLFAGNDRERAGGVRSWIKSRRQQGVAFFRYAFPRERAINGGCKMQVASFDGYRRSFGTACYMRRVFSNRMSRHDGPCSAVSLSLSLLLHSLVSASALPILPFSPSHPLCSPLSASCPFFRPVYPSLSPRLVQSYEREPYAKRTFPYVARPSLASRHSCFRMTSIMSIYSVDRALPLTAYEFQLEYVLSAAN